MGKLMLITSINNLENDIIKLNYPNIIDGSDKNNLILIENTIPDGLLLYRSEDFIEVNGFNFKFGNDCSWQIHNICENFDSNELYIIFIDGENWYHCVATQTKGVNKMGGNELNKFTFIFNSTNIIIENKGFVEGFRKDNPHLFDKL